jgi:hypothetical protein
MRTTLAAATLLAAGALLVIEAIGQEKKPQPGANPPSSFSPAQLTERALHRRAVEAVNWGMPAVNFDLMNRAMSKAKGAPNQVVYWSRPLDWKNQTLTPNPDTIYLMPFYNTKDVGPVVLEIPPAEGGEITGSVDDAWQNALEDVGPAGADRGKGGKYLILPPGYKGKAPAGYIHLKSSTFQGFAILRSNLESASDAGVAKAVAYGKRVKFYPLSQADKDPKTTFIDAAGVMFDATIPYDLRFFESLHRFVQAEPWLTRDKAMIDMLKAIGIEKGKPFKPDAKTKAVLEDAAREAHAWLEMRYETVFDPPFNKGTHWALPANPEVIEGMATSFAKPESYPTDGRGVAYSMAYFSARHLGKGQFYLMTIKDREGKPFDGGNTYRLTVPAKAPVKLYWSATAYDRATHALIRDQKWSSRASNTPRLKKNKDGSVDVYFGPKAPAGKESNWIPTSAGGKFEVLFRFYGPEKPLFARTWKLPDIEKVKGGAKAQPLPSGGKAVPVTVDNFIRAETDRVFGGEIKLNHSLGKFAHWREMLSLDRQVVPRVNRDTLYSTAVFDLDAGPVTITMPDAGKRFMSLIVIDEDHYVRGVYYGAGRRRLTRDEIGTRYVLAAFRTLADPQSQADLKAVHALQDAVKVEQPGGPGAFETPIWDQAGLKKVRDALMVLNTTLPDLRRAFGGKGEVDPVRHLIGTASAWGGNPDKDAIYLNVTPSRNDGKTAYRLTVKDVPVDAFWSITVYNAEGYIQKNEHNAYSLNGITAKKRKDGSVTVQFGGYDGKTPNCLPITPGWNYLVRLYRPRKEILSGTWRFPEAVPLK